MGAKKRKSIYNHPVSAKPVYLEKLRGVCDDHVVWKFLNAEDSAQQMAQLKTMSRNLDQNDAVAYPAPLLDALVSVYLRCPHKNPLKRAVASCLQKTELHNKSMTKLALVAQLKDILATPSDEEAEKLRSVVDNIAALLDKFFVGENCVVELWKEVFCFLHRALIAFHKHIRQASSPVLHTTRMHDCLVTTQVWTKVVQKSACRWQPELDPKVQQSLTSGFSTMFDILKDDDVMLDCRVSCGLALVLMIKLAAPNRNVAQLLWCFVPGRMSGFVPSDWWLFSETPALEMADLAPYPRMCVLNGCLAMLELDDLGMEYAQGHAVLTSALGSEVMELLPRLTNSTGKILASRTVMLLSVKARCALKPGDLATHDLLCEALHGKAPLPQRLLAYSFTHWEDPIDMVRYNSRHLFENLLECHILATNEDPSESGFIQGLLDSLLAMSWQSKSKYGPLTGLLSYLPASALLEKHPDLPAELLSMSTEQTLACHVNELYEKLFTRHYQEMFGPTECWQVTWVEPVLHVLMHGSTLHKTHVMEYTLPSLLKCNPESLTFITASLGSGQKGACGLGALVTCLKRAKILGLLNHENVFETPTLWNGVVPIATIKQALCHPNEQVRLNAFGMLCENHKTTEVVTSTDISLIQFFLPLNLSSQTPSFRQTLAALLKKLFFRIHEGTHVLLRKCKQTKKTDEREAHAAHVDRYKDFLCWVTDLLFDQLHPSAGFPNRTSSLAILNELSGIMGPGLHGDGENEFQLHKTVTPEHVQALMECFNDTFETNRVEAYKFLMALPVDTVHCSDKTRLTELLETGIRLASSARPQDCMTAAHLLRVLLSHPHLVEVLSIVRESLKISSYSGGHQGDNNDVTYKLIETLYCLLCDQLVVAEQNLLHAAATGPLYPTLHCIRYILADTDLSSMSNQEQWRHLVEVLITTCFRVAEAVASVVANSSPEGFLPSESESGCDAPENTDPLPSQDVQESEATVRLMPEYLVVCSWRSIKEVSLLLGLLTERAPVCGPEGGPGLLTVPQLEEVGGYFQRQLLETMHRGAFELAYAGFVKMCEMLWRSPVEGVHQLPHQWIIRILDNIRCNEASMRLCATRRSAGVPYFVQAIVSTEPATRGRGCFKQAMELLLVLALNSEGDGDQPEYLMKIHSMNILRALYRDTRLGEDVFPFIADGMRACIQGYSSQHWNIRNSATLLFSALMTRIFGVKRAKDDATRKNCMTGRVFFNRFPPLFPFLLEHLQLATENMGGSGAYHLHPGLYPVLMLLGRLYPSSLDGMESSLNLASFLPHVIRCASRPVYKTRMMAARAIGPLVGKDQLITTLTSLTSQLPAAGDAAGLSQNNIHGCLLQIQYLMDNMFEIAASCEVQQKAVAVLLSAMQQAKWLMSSKNPCLMTRGAFLTLAQSLLTACQGHSDLDPHANTALDVLKEVLLEEPCHEEPTVATVTPWMTEFEQTRAMILLSSLSEESGSDKTNCVSRFLRSDLYEVRLVALVYLEKHLKKSVDRDGSERDEGKTLDDVITSKDVFSELVTMTMWKEQHPECLIQVLQVLCLHPRRLKFPWTSQGKTWEAEPVLVYLLELQKHSRSEICCAAHELTGATIASIYDSADQASIRSLLERCLGLLTENCAVQQPVEARLVCAQVLVANVQYLLRDVRAKLGALSLVAWSVVMRLLQDEDADVRATMATVVTSLAQYLTPEDAGLLIPELGVQPELALSLCLSIVRATWGVSHPQETAKAFVSWIRKDLEPEWMEEEKEVRLFDKGEMNTYRDEVLFVRLVADNLELLLSSRKGDSTLRENTGSLGEELSCDLNESLTSVSKYSIKSSFLNAADYGADIVVLYRLLTLERIVSGDRFRSLVASRNAPCQVVNTLSQEAWL